MSNTSDEDICLSALKSRNDIKRRVHNGIERRRKDRINNWIYKIAELLPFKDPKRESKNCLLEKIYNFIVALKDKNEKLMFGNMNSIQVEEYRSLTKRIKELEEMNVSYYRLLQTAGIPPKYAPQDIWERRPTKYSNRITSEQVSALFNSSFANKTSNSDESSIKSTNSESSEQLTEQMCSNSSNGKKQKLKIKSKKRRLNEYSSNNKSSPSTPLLPLYPNTTIATNSPTKTVLSNAQNSTSFILLRDQNVSTVSEDTTRLLSVNSGNTINTIQGIQIRPNVATQQLQLVSTTPTIDTQINNKLISGPLIIGMNAAPPPPQQSATAVLLPNGQILPIISQPQQQQQLIYAPNQGFLLTTQQSQPTIFTGQTSNISANFATNIATKAIQLSTPGLNESQAQLNSVNNNTISKSTTTTTIEKIPSSPKHTIKRKATKKHKKIIAPKAKFLKRDNLQKVKSIINDKKKFLNNFDKLKTENQIQLKNFKSIDKNVTSDKKSNENFKLKTSKQLSEKQANKNECDILAKATQSIFSPQTPQIQTFKKDTQNERIISHISVNSDTMSDKSKERRNVESNSNRTHQNEVIVKYCDNKVIELVNDTDNDNHKIDSKNKQSMASRNKINSKKANSNVNTNHVNNGNAETDSKMNAICNTNINTNTNASTNSNINGNTNSNVVINTSNMDNTNNLNSMNKEVNERQTCLESTSSCDNSSNTTNTLTFGFSNAQSVVNAGDNHALESESELPSLLLSSLTDENDASAESVHSVSNSSLPAFLSLSPEHLNEYLPKDNNTNTSQASREQLTDDNVDFRLNRTDSGVHHSNEHETQIQHQSHKDQNFPQFSTSKSNDIVVTSSSNIESTGYSTNFSAINTNLRNNEFADFTADKLNVNSCSNPHNYLDNINTTNKVNNQNNNNFLHFSFQNDNSLMPLYPMHSYTNNSSSNINRDINFNTNRPFYNPIDSSSIVNVSTSQSSQNQSQSHPQQQTLTKQVSQHAHNTASQIPQTQSQSQSNQTNAVSIRTHRNSSSEQQLQPQHNNVRQEQRLASQHSRDSVSSVKTSTPTVSTHNKTVNTGTAVHYSPNVSHTSFSSYSAEALIRQNEPQNQAIHDTQNRYNLNVTPSRSQQQPQQQSLINMNFTDTSEVRSSSRTALSYSAESLIQSNPMNTSNQINSNKSSRRKVDNVSNISNLATNNISYYQQQSDQNGDNLFSFDNTLHSRISNTSSATPLNSVNYPQITFNSHLPDIRVTTATTSANSSFPIYTNATTVTSNSSLYSTNLATITPNLRNNEFGDFATDKLIVNSCTNTHNYLDNLNTNLTNKVNNQNNNNFLHFPIQNDNTLVPLYPMHSYANNGSNNVNRDINFNTNRPFLTPIESTTIVNNASSQSSQNPSQSQSHPQQQNLTKQVAQHSQHTSPQLAQSQTQPPTNQIRNHRNSSSDQQLQAQHNVRHDQSRHPSQHSRENVSSAKSATSTTATHKTPNSATTVHYSPNVSHNSYVSSYSAEALIRQNEPSLNPILETQNRYNVNVTPSRSQQQTQSLMNINFADTSEVRSSSRTALSYSAESLIQSNSLNNSNQINASKSSRRKVDNVSNISNGTTNNNNNSYYQPINNGNQQQTDQNSANLFSFDNTFNSRIANSSSAAPLNSVNYPQITFNSHLPDIRVPTATTSANSTYFPICTNTTTATSNSSSYSTNFSAITPNLRANEFSDFATDKLIMNSCSNPHNYLDNLNPTNKVNNQNNSNLFPFPFQNDNLMPLYTPMHSYSNNINSNINRDINFNTNRSLFNPTIDSSILNNPKSSQINIQSQNHIRPQQQTAAKQLPQHPSNIAKSRIYSDNLKINNKATKGK